MKFPRRLCIAEEKSGSYESMHPNLQARDPAGKVFMAAWFDQAF